MGEMSENGGEIGAFMAGFVIGGLVGAATALILAPQSGAETRAQITAKGEELRRAGEQQFQEYRSYADAAVADTKSKINETSEQVQERARIVLDEGKTRMAEARKKAAEVEEHLEEESEIEGTSEEVEGDAAA